ncbi:hypothetical protein [Cellvibrio sp. PSBB006]|uniref:hypothetical protein n=1 Tax=Cellvibrio sp. PSBB006 TaxID=1987723 RepID=UPI000B3B85A4|nr:hypothetical protein [Cellvibrio sp. PSBB006]ARU28684.1 hypothetical protein CBR65_15205 [Cellvibrio sp. PSBB006]
MVEGNVDKKSGAFILEYYDGNLRGVWTDFKAYRRVRIQPKKIAFLRGIVEADSKEYVVSRKMESADEEAFFLEIDGLPEHRLTSERRCQGVYGIDMVWVKKSDVGYEVEWRGNSPGQAGVEYRDNKIISVGEVNKSSGRPLEAAAESER